MRAPCEVAYGRSEILPSDLITSLSRRGLQIAEIACNTLLRWLVAQEILHRNPAVIAHLLEGLEVRLHVAEAAGQRGPAPTPVDCSVRMCRGWPPSCVLHMDMREIGAENL